MRFLLALCGVSVVVGLARPAFGDPGPGAASDPGDAAFLAALDAAGISYSTPQQAIASAKVVCTLIRQGGSGPGALSALQNQNPRLGAEHAAQFMGIAAERYCPQELMANTPDGVG